MLIYQVVKYPNTKHKIQNTLVKKQIFYFYETINLNSLNIQLKECMHGR